MCFEIFAKLTVDPKKGMGSLTVVQINTFTSFTVLDEKPGALKLLLSIYLLVEPFSSQCSFFISLKILENLYCSDVFRGIKREHYEEKYMLVLEKYLLVLD